MKLYTIVFFATVATQAPNASSAQKAAAPREAALRISDRALIQEFSTEVKRRIPELPSESIERKSAVYLQGLPSARTALADRTCAGTPCKPEVLKAALFDA